MENIINPLPNGLVTSKYGWRVRNNKEEFHRGLDISPKYIGQTVIFPVSGKIFLCGLSNSFGCRVWVKVADRYYYVLAHLQELNKCYRDGFDIKQGDPVGIVGNTGLSDAIHLHYEFRRDPFTPETSFDSIYFSF